MIHTIKKVFFVAALMFTTGVLTTMINTANNTQTASDIKIVGLVSSERNVLGTAD